jgi:hypothetical protein
MAPRRRPAPVAVALAVCLLLVPAAAAAVTGADSTEIGPGTVTRPAEGRTVVSVQGWVIDGETNRKKPARLAAAGPRARTAWVYTGTRGVALVLRRRPAPRREPAGLSPGLDGTLVYELDPRTHDRA